MGESVVKGVDLSEFNEWLRKLEEEDPIYKLRKIFDRKVDYLMNKYGYDDIDEGELEAVTERKSGIFYLFKPDGTAHAYFFLVTKNDVIIRRCSDFDA